MDDYYGFVRRSWQPSMLGLILFTFVCLFRDHPPSSCIFALELFSPFSLEHGSSRTAILFSSVGYGVNLRARTLYSSAVLFVLL